MSLWWLLWPLSGLLGWAWANHIMYRVGYDSRLRWVALPLELIVGPVSFLVSVHQAVQCSRQHRWGLRFR